VDVDIAVTQSREHLARPDRGRRLATGHDPGEAVEADVLEVEVVDPRAPFPEERDRITTADRQVARVEAQPHVRSGEDLFDLARRFDVGPRLVVEHRLVAPIATAGDDPRQALTELVPGG